MKRSALALALIVALLVSTMVGVTYVHFSKAQSGTNVSGIISSDTMWTQASSPYLLVGNVLVNNSVMLTIQPGVTVNFNGYYLRVNGTLNATGTSSDNIVFNIPNGAGSGDGAIEFEGSSLSWNDATKSGSIIENAFITSTWELYPTILIDSVSPKLDNNTIYCTNQVSNNDAINVEGIAAPIISNNTVEGQITASGGTICNNTVFAARYTGIYLLGNATVYGNLVFGSYMGIYATANSEYTTQSLIQENLVFDNTRGIELDLYGNYNPFTIITQNNTISNNTDGVFIGSYSGSVSYLISGNNIYNNSNYNFLLAGSVNSNIDATYNWWGTNDSQAISQKIYDFKDNLNLGTVNYVPFLNSSNPLAPVYIPSVPSPSPGPSPTPTPSPVTPTPPSSLTFVSTSPVFTGTDSFDLSGVKDPSVIYANGSYYMSFSATPTGEESSGNWTIGLAQSTNLQTWTVIGQVLTQTQSWENPNGVSAPCLIVNGSTVYMFYGSEVGGGYSSIGLATCPVSSLNSTSAWTKYSENPILSPPNWAGSSSIFNPSVILVGSTYYMYFVDGNGQVLLATTSASSFPYGWTIYGSAPILTASYSIETSDVFTVPTSNLYFMQATLFAGPLPVIYWYYSSDLIHWDAYPSEPYLSGGQYIWDTNGVGSPGIIVVGDNVYTLFDAASSNPGCIGLVDVSDTYWANNVPSPTPTPTVVPTVVPTPTPTPTPASNLPSPNLSFVCISSTTTSGFNVQIQGSLTGDGAGLPDAGIQLSDSVTGGATWQDLAYLKTGNDGNFSCVWNPSVSGFYGIEATWSGDSDYSSASAVYNFAIEPFNSQNQNVFSVTSNSTLTSLTFDSTTNELSFGVSGPSGTTGFTEVCVPQSLIPDISKLNVTLDGGTINYNSISEGNVWLISFTYHHSSHTVVITFGSQTSIVPEFPTLIILPLLATVILLSIIFVRERKPKMPACLTSILIRNY